MKNEPACAICGSTNDLQVHHILPYHLFPDLELVETNLITLCDGVTNRAVGCHLRYGHLGNMTNYNPNVRESARRFCEAD
jgi:5-methylcytosine-specific restriction endonuclease McrA